MDYNQSPVETIECHVAGIFVRELSFVVRGEAHLNRVLTVHSEHQAILLLQLAPEGLLQLVRQIGEVGLVSEEIDSGCLEHRLVEELFE